MRPALKISVGSAAAERCATVANVFFMPMGEHPPCTYPVSGCSSRCGSMDTDFSPTAAAALRKSNSHSTGTRKT